jgi:hypothetical protein
VTNPPDYVTAPTTGATGIHYEVGIGDSGPVTFALSAKKPWALGLVEIAGMRQIGPLDQIATATSGSTLSTTIMSGATPSTRLSNDALVAVLFDDASPFVSDPTIGFAMLAGSSGSKNWTADRLRDRATARSAADGGLPRDACACAGVHRGLRPGIGLPVQGRKP